MLHQAFDRYASSYDDHFSRSVIGQAQRVRVYRWLRRFLPASPADILELNCGTGEDAAYLSGLGYAVTASDISSEMIRVASQKPGNAGVTFLCTPIQTIHRQLDGRTYDVLFSDFGGLNCLAPDELRAFTGVSSGLLSPGSRFIAVVMGRRCWWERFFFTWRKEPVKARRRLSSSGVDTEIEGRRFDTWYYSPEELSALFSGRFNTLAVKPIGLFIPPSYLESWIAPRRGLFAILRGLETVFGSFSMFSDRADHYLIVLQKKSL